HVVTVDRRANAGGGGGVQHGAGPQRTSVAGRAGEVGRRPDREAGADRERVPRGQQHVITGRERSGGADERRGQVGGRERDRGEGGEERDRRDVGDREDRALGRRRHQRQRIEGGVQQCAPGPHRNDGRSAAGGGGA